MQPDKESIIEVKTSNSKKNKKLVRDLKKLFKLLNKPICKNKIKIKGVYITKLVKMGGYTLNEKYILINPKYTKDKDTTIALFLHELAHAYIHQILKSKNPGHHGREFNKALDILIKETVRLVKRKKARWLVSVLVKSRKMSKNNV